jgi:hypothetical protein
VRRAIIAAGTGTRPRPRAGLVLLALAAAASAGCTESPLEQVDPASAPGQSTPTTEIEIPVDALPSWRDTTYVGYAIPSTSSFRVLADSAEFEARLLGRVLNLPDSIAVADTTRGIERFADSFFRLLVDTGDTAFAAAGVEVEVYSLGRPYVQRETSWTLAAGGEPWTTPGGDLGELVAAAAFDSIRDTMFVPVVVNADSLLTAWRATDGEPGFLIRVVGPGTWLDVRGVAIGFDAALTGLDSLVTGLRTPGGSTVLFDPQTPDPGGTLRLGGLPAARIYAAFDLPDTWQDLPLRGSTINRASLVLRAAPREPEPFALERRLAVTAVQLLADPFEVGEKTPVGLQLSGSVPMGPEELEAAGDELLVPITSLIALWAAADPDSAPALRVGLIADPEGGDPGFQRFGSGEDAGLRPSLRILVTPRVPFRLP